MPNYNKTNGKEQLKRFRIPLLIVISVLIIDQILKFWIKLHMTLGQEFYIAGNWFIIHFTENEGMAFGFSFGGSTGKLFLSIFRILAIFAIGYYVKKLIDKKAHWGLITCFSLILAGAIGNMIDSAVYGVLFSASSYHTVASFLPEEGGYAPLLFGKVVDMFYFPIIKGTYPSWFPFWSGSEFQFFRPVFNISDASISVGVIILILFQGVFYKTPQNQENTVDSTENTDI